jgi:hypothetical protein
VVEPDLPEHVRRARLRHPSAYEPWTPMQDHWLTLYAELEDDHVLSKRFGRTTGAIDSRLVKLGVRRH